MRTKTWVVLIVTSIIWSRSVICPRTACQTLTPKQRRDVMNGVVVNFHLTAQIYENNFLCRPQPPFPPTFKTLLYQF